MTESTDFPIVDRKAQRQGELEQCRAEIQAVLDRYDATFGVIIQTVYAAGAAQHNPIVQVVTR